MRVQGYVAINDETRLIDYVHLRLGGGDFRTRIVHDVHSWESTFQMTAGKDSLDFKLGIAMTAEEAVAIFERKIVNLEWVQRRIKRNFKLRVKKLDGTKKKA